MGKRIAYFAGCAANYVDPDIGKATVQVLERNGFDLVYPEQVCCGIPLMRQGNMDAAMKKARHNVASLLRADCDIVTSCSSCAITLKHYYPIFLDSVEATALSRKTFESGEYLARLWKQRTLDVGFGAVKMSLLYHAPCHLKAMGSELVDSRLKLMALVPGLSVSRIDRGCCGMAGTFGAKKSTHQYTVKIMRGLVDAIKESKVDAVATDCPTCKLQIEQGTGRPVVHPVQVFQKAYAAHV